MKKIIFFFILSLTLGNSNAQYKIEKIETSGGPFTLTENIVDYVINSKNIYLLGVKGGRSFSESLISVYSLNDKIEKVAAFYAPISPLAESYHFAKDNNDNIIILARKGERIEQFLTFNLISKTIKFFSLTNVSNKSTYTNFTFFPISNNIVPLSNITKFNNGFVGLSYDYSKSQYSNDLGITIQYEGISAIPNFKGAEFVDGPTKKISKAPLSIYLDKNDNIWGLYNFKGNDFVVKQGLNNGAQIFFRTNDQDYNYEQIYASPLNDNNFIIVKKKYSGNNKGIYIFRIVDGVLKQHLFDTSILGSIDGPIAIDEENNLLTITGNSLISISPENNIKKIIDLGEFSNSYEHILTNKRDQSIYLYRGISYNALNFSPNVVLLKISKEADAPIEQLIPDFSFGILGLNQSIYFKDNSKGNPSSWKWDFGDGTSSTEQNPEKIYSKAGKYKVSLMVSKRGVESKSISKDINILDEATPPPIVRSIKITSPESGTKVSAFDPLKIKLELTTGTILASCKVEINSLTGSLIKSLGNINGASLNNFPYSIKDVPTGEYWLKVSGLSQPNLKDSVKIQVQNLRFTPGVTLVTHGFQLFGYSDLEDWTVRSDKNKGQISFCEAIKKRVESEGGSASIYENDIQNPGKWILKGGTGSDSDEIILFYNWSKLSNDFNDGALESAADHLFAMLVQSETVGNNRIPASLLKSDLQFHLIGHSRGNILLLQVLHRALKYFPNKKFHHFTLLDPHPAKPMNDINSSNELLSLPGVYGSPNRYPSEPNISLPANVIKADVIYRQANAYEPIIDEALLFKSSRIFNLFLFASANFTLVDWNKLNGFYGNFSGISVTNTPNTFSLNEESVRNGASNKLPHSGVHEWYKGTILPDNKSFEADGREDWYTILPRNLYGYNNGRVAGNFEKLRPIENAKALKDFEDRIISRTSFALNPVYNSNFQYKNYGWSGFGGEVKLLQGINDKVVLRKPNIYNDGLINLGLEPLLKHNYMYFNKEDSFLGIQIANVNTSAKLKIVFYNTKGQIGDITLRTPEAKTYFVKIPGELKGNVGNFAISLDKTTNLQPLIISKIYTTNSEIIEGEIASFNWRNEEKSLTKNVFGVAADGTSRILIKVGNENQSSLLNTNRAAKVILSLNDPDNGLNTQQYIGSLKPIDNLSQLTNPLSITHGNEISAVSSQKINNAFYFDYQAPTDFSRTYKGLDDTQKSERSVVLEITLLDATNQEIGRYRKNISIVRPPLMLAHGLGGEGSNGNSTWRNFRYSQKDGKEILFTNSDLFLVKRDINLLPTASFDDNSDVLLGKSTKPKMEDESFDAMIKRMNDLGYACAKVDYVAHSMGGSVLRNTLDKPEYKNSKNYNQGYVNKFITICTPHQGSPLGDIFSEFAPLFNSNQYGYGDRALLKQSGFFDSNLNIAFPAIQNLSIRKENGGVKFLKQTIPNHVIVGNYSNKFNSEKEMLESLTLEKETKGFDVLSLTLAFGALRKFSKCDCKKEFQELANLIYKNANVDSDLSVDGFITFLIGNNFAFNASYPSKQFTAKFLDWANSRIYKDSPSFLSNSDIVVSVESQSAGRLKTWQKNTSSVRENSYTVFDGITHNFNPAKATGDLVVGNRVLELLNLPLSSIYFAKTLEGSPEITSTISCFNDCQVTKVNNNNFSIYPNPTQDYFELDLTEMGNSKEFQINIFDEQGNLIHNQSVKNNCCPTISPSIHRPGVYSVNIISDQGVKTKKIIINK